VRDLHFARAKEHRTAVAAFQYATLAPLLGRRRGSPDRRKDLYTVQAIWRKQLLRLRAAGWNPACDVAAMARMANCRPVAITVPVSTGSCGYGVICPFCYARQATNVWTSLRDRLQTPQDPAGYTLVTRERSTVLLYDKHKDPTEAVRTALATLLVAGRRSKLLSLAAGAATWTAVYPRRGQWCLHRREACLLPATTPVPTEVPGRVRVFLAPTQAQTLQAVAHLYRYPVALLRTEPDMLLAALRAWKGRRLTTTTGILRKTSRRQT
jgi:hypothetical protein